MSESLWAFQGHPFDLKSYYDLLRKGAVRYTVLGTAQGKVVSHHRFVWSRACNWDDTYEGGHILFLVAISLLCSGAHSAGPHCWSGRSSKYRYAFHFSVYFIRVICIEII